MRRTNGHLAFTVFVVLTFIVSLFGFGPVSNAQAASTDVVVTWGKNEQGQLGNGNTTDSSIPILPQGLTGATAIASATAGNHSLALMSDGTVMAWGENQVGNLGNGQTGGHNATPAPVIDSTGVPGSKLSNVVAIGAGGGHSLAVKADGSVWAWGDNSTAQLGQGFPGAPIPVPQHVVANGFAAQHVVQVVGGGGFSLALTSTGQVWCWGLNNFGACGNGTQGDGNFTVVPTPVLDETGAANTILSNVTSIGAGGQHSLAVKSDGSLRSWGFNQNGQLGDGFYVQGCCALSTHPITPVGLTGKVFTAVAGGDTHSMALQNDGTVWTWGLNSSGQLGRGDITGGPNPVPTQVSPNLLSGVVAISAGGSASSMALKSDGNVFAWGSNTNGQLGIGSADGSGHPLPLQVANLHTATAIAMGTAHSVALATNFGFTVNVSTSGAGTVNPGSGKYAGNTNFVATATPNPGNMFLGWTVDNVFVGFDPTLVLPVTRDRNVAAAFAAAPSFCDVNANTPYADAIKNLAARNVIRGYGDGCFHPDDFVIRAQAAGLVARSFGLDKQSFGNQFSDQCDANNPSNCIDPELWNDVGVLNFYNIARGYGDGTYRPRVNVLHVQVVSLVTRAFVSQNLWTQATQDDSSIYPGVPVDSGHRLDVVTYLANTGMQPLPTTASIHVPWNEPSGYAGDSTRGWFAQVLWTAYSAYYSTNHVTP